MSARPRAAVIPAAGLGTRMRPFSDVVPKELAPLGATPLIHFTAAEAAAAGIDELTVVLRRGKEAIRRSLERLQDGGGLPGVRLRFVDQAEPRGLGDAIACCRESVGERPFAVLLPDNLLIPGDVALGAMLDLFARRGEQVFGVVEVGPDRSEEFGNSGRFDQRPAPVEPGVLRITRLWDKRPGRLRVGAGQLVRRTCGRYVCRGDLFERIERARTRIRGELDDVPVLQQAVEERGALGYLLPVELFDAGTPRGLLAAGASLLARGAPC